MVPRRKKTKISMQSIPKITPGGFPQRIPGRFQKETPGEFLERFAKETSEEIPTRNFCFWKFWRIPNKNFWEISIMSSSSAPRKKLLENFSVAFVEEIPKVFLEGTAKVYSEQTLKGFPKGTSEKNPR